MFKLSKIQIVCLFLACCLTFISYLANGPIAAFLNIVLFFAAAYVSSQVKAEHVNGWLNSGFYSKALKSLLCGLKKWLYIAYLNWVILLLRLTPIPIFLILVAISIYQHKFDVSPMARYCFYGLLILLLLSAESYKIIKYFKKRNRK